MKIRSNLNNKGLVTIAWAMLLVILAAIIGFVLYSVLQYHLLLTEIQRSASSDFYNAEFGVYRAIWRIARTNPTSGFTESLNLGNGNTVDIVVTYNGPSDYTISSTARVSGAARKAITAQYAGGSITSWD